MMSKKKKKNELRISQQLTVYFTEISIKCLCQLSKDNHNITVGRFRRGAEHSRAVAHSSWHWRIRVQPR